MRIVNKISGFTIVELMIAIAIGSIMSAIFYNILLGSFTDTAATNKEVKATTEIKRALSIIDADTTLTTAFLTAVPAQYSDAYGPHRLGSSGAQAWSYSGDSANSRVLILENLSTTQNSGGSNRQPVYINSSSFNCTTSKTRQPKLTHMAIYFVYQQTLYRRLLIDTSQTLCPGHTQYQLRTCPPDIAQGSLHASCQARDEVIASNVSKFRVAYYQASSNPGGVLISGQYTNPSPTLLQSATIIEVTIEEDFAGLTDPVSITQSFTRIN